MNADDYGGLVSLLADLPDDAHHPDANQLDAVMAQPWAAATLDALVRTTTVRQAARELEVHHKTLQSRTEALCNTLGWDPLDGHGRIRLGIAYLTWRLQHSRVLDLPPPTP